MEGDGEMVYGNPWETNFLGDHCNFGKIRQIERL